MTLIAMRGINKAFSGVPALVDASLGIESGQVMALVGQNGAGKSTLIKILTGAYKRDSGSIAFGDGEVDFASPGAAQAAGISTIYQEINLVPQRSVAENIFLGREPKRFGLLDWGRMHREAEEVLGRFEIALDVRAPLGRFNAATRQMVAIARAVSRNARLVIMDEATSSLDDREVDTLFRTIRTLTAGGTAVLFVSHRLDELYAVCDRVTIMRDGQTVGAHDMAAISKMDLVTSMLGRALSSVERDLEAIEPTANAVPLLDVRAVAAGRKLQGVDVSVGRGEVVALAGLLGSGRTETARIVFGADRPDSGSIRVDGAEQAFAEPGDAIAAGFGFCSEDRKIEGIVPEMSVRENLTLAFLPQLARAGIVDEARQRALVDRFIALLGVKLASQDQKIRELSGGNQQKVLLARWLVMNPRLLILDEPTRGIDVGAKAEILKLIRRLASEGLGVLMISSELEEVLSLADRVTVLSDGRTAANLSGEAVSEERILAAMAADAPRLAPAGAAHG